MVVAVVAGALSPLHIPLQGDSFSMSVSSVWNLWNCLINFWHSVQSVLTEEFWLTKINRFVPNSPPENMLRLKLTSMSKSWLLINIYYLQKFTRNIYWGYILIKGIYIWHHDFVGVPFPGNTDVQTSHFKYQRLRNPWSWSLDVINLVKGYYTICRPIDF